MDEPLHAMEDTYRVFVPIEDDALMKSVEVDENGDFIVQGVMTSDDKDEEEDSITPNGMDCSYFLEKGWVKYEHGNRPDQFIGEPIEVRVGKFQHPKLQKSVNGIHVKARLFAHRDLTRQAVKAIEDLQKSNTKRTMGWSIEGNVKERDRKSGKILKSVLRNVVLTMNPVNTMTWAELAKSFAKDHELTIDMPMEKAMDTAAAAEITPQSVEGKEKKDKQQEWIDLFRSFCKQFKKSFVTSTEDNIEIEAFQFCVQKGLDYEDAEQFAQYVASRFDVLQSLGGETMAAEHNDLASLLDSELEELEKSLLGDEEEELEDDEELEKSMDDSDDDSDDSDDDSDDSDDDSDDSDDDSDDSDDSDDEGGTLQKSAFAKSFGASEENQQALEVSSFLSSLVEEVGFSMDGFEKSLQGVRKQNAVIVGALQNFGEVMKSLTSEIQTLRAENEELKKSFDDTLNRPVGRKSVVNTREAQTLTKSVAKPTGLSRAQIADVLEKSFDAGEITGNVITKFEAGIPLQDLAPHIPDAVKSRIGL